MKSEAHGLALRSNDLIERGNILREYVQASALRSLHEARAFERLSFVGGTALRFLFDLPRYSEDLDFKALRADIDPFLERRADAAYITREGLASLLSSD